MIKKLAALGTILAGAAYLQNRERRERLLSSAKDFIGNARQRLGQFSEESGKSPVPGATTRHTGSAGHAPPRGTGGGNVGGIY